MHKAYYQSPLGLVEMIANDHAITEVSIRDKEVHKNARMPSPANVPVLEKCLHELDEYFKGERKNFSLKLERDGTEFQREVWRALDEIPFGKTVSYSDIATKIGRPEAIRAVGLAMGKNPHWIIAPCHRVIGKNRKLTGYAGGLWRKKWLLDFEQEKS